MEKPHTGLDDCLNMLLSCFRKRMSGRKRERERFQFQIQGSNIALAEHTKQSRDEMSKIADAHSVSSCVVKTIQSNVISNGK